MGEPRQAGTVLEAGVPRSGNSWVYRILTSLYRAAGVPWRSYVENHPIHSEAKQWPLSLAGQADINMVSITPGGCQLGISYAFAEPITDFADFVRSCLVVWTHSPYDRRAASMFARFARVVYVIRDPRDVLVSMAHFRHTEYSRRFHPHAATRTPRAYIDQNADDLAWFWVRHVISYLAVQSSLGVHVVFYERLGADTLGEVSALARALGLELGDSEVAAAAWAADFTAMRAESPQHLRSGRSGQWREELTAAQAQRVEELAGPLLGLLGYAGDGLPAVPAGPLAVRLRAALDQARSLSIGRCRPGWGM